MPLRSPAHGTSTRGPPVLTVTLDGVLLTYLVVLGAAVLPSPTVQNISPN